MEIFFETIVEGRSIQDIKFKTEICDELSAIGEQLSNEEWVVYVLASLLESFSVLWKVVQM